MSSPIVPNTPNVNGRVITVVCDITSGGATTTDTATLPTYAPLIDVRVGHPVLSLAYISTATNSTGSEAYYPANEMARGTSGDGAGEWQVVNSNSVEIYHAANQDGIVLVTYIAFGSQMA